MASTYRRRLGIVRFAAGLVLLVTLAYQVTDLATHHVLVPIEYFTYFTVDSTILNIILLLAAGWSARRGTTDSRLLTSAAMAIVPYAIVTCIVYNLLLRGLPATKYLGQDWHNEVVHVVAPIFLTVDWFLLRLKDEGRPRLSFGAIGIVLIFPIVWIVYTMIHGGFTRYYPYPFLDPNGSLGVRGVVIYSVVLTAFIVLLSVAAIAVTRAGSGRRRRSVVG